MRYYLYLSMTKHQKLINSLIDKSTKKECGALIKSMLAIFLAGFISAILLTFLIIY